MEKRLFIAFALSFLVLTVWGVINPRPQPKQKSLEKLQLIENKRDAEMTIPAFEKQQIPEKKKGPEAISAVIKTLENEKLVVEFSNIGGSITNILIKEHKVSLPITNILALSEYDRDEFVLSDITDSSISYSLEKNGAKITKQYVLSEDDYIINSNIEIQKMDEMLNNKDILINGFFLDISRLDKKLQDSRDQSLFEYSVASESKIFRKSSAFKFSDKNNKKETGPVKWLGFRDRYFCAIVKPEHQAKGFDITYQREKKLAIEISAESPQRIGDVSRYEAFVYVGPQKLGLLKSYNMGFEDIMKFSNWGLLDTVAKGIYKFMNFMHKFIPNWGICIILISFIIYGAMYPLTMKGMLSMKRMQTLQPTVTKLREQHKNNPQKLNKEIMELYKENKVNPLGGCFPLLLQMPIFIGLYQVLWRSVSFKGAGFLWIKDLSQPDRLLIFPFTLPVIGNELNILPVIMVVVMAIQQKISSKNMAVTDPAQIAQQKMMMTIFPLFLGFIFYKFASGLSLYFTIFYLMSTFTQWKMSKMTKVAQ